MASARNEAQASSPVGAPPAFRPRTRWPSFSLRTLLVAVALLALALGWCVSRGERERRALQVIVEVGRRADIGKLVFAQPRPDETALVGWLRSWLPQSYFDPLVELELVGPQIEDSVLPQVAAFESLHTLRLEYTNVTDDGLTWLAELPRLRALNLRDTTVDDAGLAHLQVLTQLRSLDLRGTQVSAAGVAALQQALPNCQIVGPTDRPPAGRE